MSPMPSRTPSATLPATSATSPAAAPVVPRTFVVTDTTSGNVFQRANAICDCLRAGVDGAGGQITNGERRVERILDDVTRRRRSGCSSISVSFQLFNHSRQRRQQIARQHARGPEVATNVLPSQAV